MVWLSRTGVAQHSSAARCSWPWWFDVIRRIKYGWPKNILNSNGIQQSILDVCATFPIDFVIADGIVAMEGNGPLNGTPRPLGTLVLADDPVAADSTCARLMGLEPGRIPHVHEASHFLGNSSPALIDQAGEALWRPPVPFQVVPEFQHLAEFSHWGYSRTPRSCPAARLARSHNLHSPTLSRSLRPRVLDFTLILSVHFQNMITISKEDYLKAIAEAEAEGQTVIPATLAHWLSVTRPAVTFALKRLTKDGLVSVTRDRHIRLTQQGREIAERTIVRHHLIERMLAEIFGLAWYEVHDEAERLEHAVSPTFEKRLSEKLGHKDTCPHGNGLALRTPAERRKRGMRLLTEATVGESYRVASVYERDRKLLEFFDKEGIRPGVRISVKSSNYDGTISLSVDKNQIRLGMSAAQKIWVSKT